MPDGAWLAQSIEIMNLFCYLYNVNFLCLFKALSLLWLVLNWRENALQLGIYHQVLIALTKVCTQIGPYALVLLCRIYFSQCT